VIHGISYYIVYDVAEAVLRNRTLEVYDILEVKEGTIGA